MLNYITKYLFFFIGLFITALGSTFMINVQYLGLQPFDVLYVGLSEKTGFTIGTWSIIIGSLLVFTSFILSKQRLKIGTILDTILLGVFLDFILHKNIFENIPKEFPIYLFLPIGIFLIGFGCSMVIFSNLGAGPIDLFMLTISKKMNLSIQRTTTILEASALIVGFFLGGTVFIGTIIFCLLIGPIIQYSLLFWDKTLKINLKKMP